MKYTLAFVIVCFFASAEAQDLRLDDYQEKRVKFTNKSMSVLGGWAVANVTGGLIMMRQTAGVNEQFWKGNALWNTVNLGLAGGALLANSLEPKPSSFTEFLRKETAIQQSFIFNAGLDLGYMATGWALIERHHRFDGEKADELLGYGRALLLQGGFLLVFDVICYGIKTKAIKQLYEDLHVNVSLGLAGNMATLRFVF